MQLVQALFSQGFGSRRQCAAWITRGCVSVAGEVITAPDAEVSPDDLVLTVDGQHWRYQPTALVLLNKPAGTECSARPTAWPSVLSLLPEPLRVRGVQPVGRLDQDTTGVLLLTDDGTLIHRLISPKRQVPKVYDVTTAEPVTPDQLSRLRQGVLLDDQSTARASQVELIDTHQVRLTLTEGRYHQVKRMVAAVGNHVKTLHRSQFGPVSLPPDLAPGQWCWLQPKLFGA